MIRAADFRIIGMKKIGILLIASALVLSACGKRDEGDSSGAQGFNAAGEPTVNGTVDPDLGAALLGQDLTVRVISNEASLLTGGQETAQITAAVTNDINQPEAGVDIQFSSSAGVLQSAQAVTDENGEATAVLSLKYDSANQDITVTATVGEFSGMARVVAEGSTIEVTGDDNVVLGSDLNIEAKLTAGDGEPIANEIVTVASRAGNVLSTTSGVTDPEGVLKITVGSANGDDMLTFSALQGADGVPSVTQSYEFIVSDDQLKFAANSAEELPVNIPHQFSVNWSFGGQPIVGRQLNFTITAGQVVGASTATTDANGDVSVSVLSSIAGEVTLHVEAADGSVNNRHKFNFFGAVPASIRTNSTSTRVNTRDKATILAVVKDANGNPVKNTVVEFSSANLKGGQLSSTLATTNVDGEAEITFSAGTTPTEEDEIRIFSEVQGSSINSSVSLTVVEPALNITIGSANVIQEIGNGTQYSIPYVVQVADGGGTALEDASVRLSIEPVMYRKGYMQLINSDGLTRSQIAADESFTANSWATTSQLTISCLKEDVNGNRVLDENEDINGNGTLDPQDPAIIMPVDETLSLPTLESNGVLTTDATGSGYFNVVYPVTNAAWAQIRVVARAQALGVEAEDSYTTMLSSDATQLNNTNIAPVNATSPYGITLVCSDTN